jgi:DNA-binding NarL/FixJ family response regulator
LITGKLTQREIEVLQSLAKSLSNKEISQKVFLSEGTIRNRISLIIDNPGVAGRTRLPSSQFGMV